MTTETQLQDEELDTDYAANEELYEPYRSVSKMATFSLIFALFALTGLIFPVLLFVAFLAVAFGLAGRRNLNRYPAELTGRTAANLGIVLGILLLVGGSTLHTYIYMTEVPEGYERLSFAELQLKDEDSGPMGAPPLPTELDGKRIFIKGYVHPGVSEVGEIKKFVLVPDMGTCCFGGQPKLTDMVEVTITGDRGIRYSQLKRKLAGTFHVSFSFRPKKVAGGLNGGYYGLDADLVR